MKPCIPALVFCCAAFSQTGAEITISGRITDALTHQPVAGANVLYGGAQAATDATGAYSVHVKTTGHLGFFVISKTGYVPLMTLLEKTRAGVAPGSSQTRDFELIPPAIISGRLVDRDSGEPLAGFTVSAATHGNQSLRTGPRTGPNGTFTFTNLNPEDYILEFIPPASGKVASGDPKPAEPDYGRSWFPGVPREDMAVPVTVTAGEKRQLEIRLQKRELHHVAGLIEIPQSTEADLENDVITIRVAAGRRPGRPIIEGELSKTGPFHIDGLDEGSYTLSATTKTTYASRKIDITDRNIDDVKIVMRPFISVRVAVTVAEDKAAVPPDFSLGLRPLLPSTAADVFTHLEDIPPGEYWPVPITRPQYAVASVSFNGRPVVHTTIDLEAPESTVDIVLTSRPSGVTGIVRDNNQNPVPGASVALLPELLPDTFEKFDEAALHISTSDETGAFRFARLAPGRYKAVALVGDDLKRDRDLVFLRDRMRFVDATTLDFGQTAHLDLHVK
jgi:hypothetical protein